MRTDKSKQICLAPPISVECFLYSKRDYFLFSFAITAAGIVLSGGPKKSPRASSIVQFKFSICSFKTSESVLIIKKVL